jgi:plastocyanin
MNMIIRKKISINLFLSLLFYFSVSSYSQTLHIVQATSNRTFVPSDITINVGDTVRWVNAGGLHNVVADDGSFTNGNPSSSAWVFDHIFNAVGNKRYFCSQHGSAGGIGMAGIVRVINPTGILDIESNLREYQLNQNYPNPFNPTTTIGYVLQEKTNAKLTFLNAIGEEIAVLVNEEQDKGYHKVQFNAANLPSGVYFYKLAANDFVSTKKMLLVK